MAVEGTTATTGLYSLGAHYKTDLDPENLENEISDTEYERSISIHILQSN